MFGINSYLWVEHKFVIIVGKARRFGAFSGVFTPSILSILGVIMFLRLPWIVGQAGLWGTLGIIALAHIISITTGLSVSSVATDKKVETGGSYYIISRSLGLPIGGTLGLALFVGLSFSVSLYLIGFSEAFLSYFGFEVSTYTIRIAGSIVLFLVTAITFVSTSLAIRFQYIILVAMVLSLVSIFAGRHDFHPAETTLWFTDGGLPWIALFAIFFPAVTGFQAGVSMSGDLKDPRKNIPVGTMAAIFSGLLVYVGLTVLFALTIDRGLLVNDPHVLFQVSLVPQLVIAGIFAATLSSGLASIMTAPRILQAVAMDRIFPVFFAKGYGKSNEPRNALIFAFLIAQAGILIGDLNVIARVVTIFFILIYGFLNITYVIESWAGSDFRPSFKIPRIVSLIGAVACIVVMIQLDVVALLAASVILTALFLFLKKKELTLQSGDTWTGVWSSLVKTGLGRLQLSSKKARNWRPNVMLFSGGEKSRPHLIEMGNALVGKMGVFTNFELAEQPGGDILFGLKEQPLPATGQPGRGVFTRRHTCRDVYEGIDVISRVYGFTGFEPNTVLMGWGRNTRNPEKFARLLSSLKRQDFNNLFLTYDKEKGFGKYERIDVWWSGRGRALSLAVYLLRFITSADKWRTAKIRILTISNDSSRADSLYSLINQLLDNNRIRAEVKVINNGIEQLPHEKIIGAESMDADLTMMELPDFSVKEPEAVIEKANLLTESVHTSLLISASGFFDELVVPGEFLHKTVDKLPEDTERPGADVLHHLIPASREIIASEVNNVAETSVRFLKKFYEDGLEQVMELDRRVFPELESICLKNLDAAQMAVGEEKQSEQDKALLRVLNDLSFHSQRYITSLREHKIADSRKVLERVTAAYLDELRALINVMPEHIRIRLNKKDFTINKHDKPGTRAYKLLKMTQSVLIRRPVTHKVKVTPAARFFLYHKRLEGLREIMADLSLHAFRETAEIRKILMGLHELIEKARLGRESVQKTRERIKLERNRLVAKIRVLENESQNFYYQTGTSLYENLLNDLQQYSHYLESTGANIRSKSFATHAKKDLATVEEIGGFAAVWEKNLGVFVNKVALDFYILSVKSRIHAKAMKYHVELSNALESGLIRQLDAYISFASKLESGGIKECRNIGKLDHSGLGSLALTELYQRFYIEIGGLLNELPDKLETSGEQLGEKIRDIAFSEAETIQVSFRKTLEFLISTEFIDYTIKETLHAESMLQRQVAEIKDMVRLVNFSLDTESKDDATFEDKERSEQAMTVVRRFADMVSFEKKKLMELPAGQARIFEEGLKRCFEPISSATIGKFSAVSKKKNKSAEHFPLIGRLNKHLVKTREVSRNWFVDLLYGKSEGQLWFSSVEKETGKPGRSNKQILSFAEAMTPDANVLRDLPFYYASLFSGHSGTNDDFWVGMGSEVNACKQAVGRFKAGMPGALLITGARSSGKSSLSKKIAEQFFNRENIHVLRAPQGCHADAQLFARKLTEALGAQNRKLEDVFRALPRGKAVVIQDLGLWWERRPGGNAVILLLRDLIDRFGHKCLFIVNVNSHALKLIDQQNDLKSYALDVVECEPFDARELKDMIMLRHHAGGMKFIFNKKGEADMSAWDIARMFSSLFDLSYGNPGTATILWMSSIKKVSGKNLVMDPFRLPSLSVFDQLSTDQWFYLQQFIVNRRFSVEKLALILGRPHATVMTDIRNLVRAGLLVEKFEGIYAIRPGMDLYLADQLKHKKRL